MTTASMTVLVCTSPPLTAGTVAVRVTVVGKGRASSNVMFTYTGPAVSTISRCTG